jgi:hypothetical protein
MTAKEFIPWESMGVGPEEGKEDEWWMDMMLRFAKYHVKEALSKKATMNLTYPEPYEDSNEIGLTFANADEISRGGEYGSVRIDQDSILNAYPEENIQ